MPQELSLWGLPKVIHGQSISDTGIVVNTLVDVVIISHISQISKRKLVIPSIDFNENHQYSLITYVDGLTSNISSYLSELYKYGMQTSYFGGGAGSLSLQQKPCVFTNDGIFQDSAYVCHENENAYWCETRLGKVIILLQKHSLTPFKRSTGKDLLKSIVKPLSLTLKRNLMMITF